MPSRRGRPSGKLRCGRAPTGKGAEKAEQRKEEARTYAFDYIDSLTENLRKAALGTLKEFMEKLVEDKKGDPVMTDLVMHVDKLQACLQDEEDFALKTSEALREEAAEGKTSAQSQYCQRVGLNDLYGTWTRTVQDAIAMRMISDTEACDSILGDQVQENVRSRLKHAYVIQKRLLRDIGQQLLEIATEGEDLKPPTQSEPAPQDEVPQPTPISSQGTLPAAAAGPYPMLPPTHSAPYIPPPAWPPSVAMDHYGMMGLGAPMPPQMPPGFHAPTHLPYDFHAASIAALAPAAAFAEAKPMGPPPPLSSQGSNFGKSKAGKQGGNKKSQQLVPTDSQETRLPDSACASSSSRLGPIPGAPGLEQPPGLADSDMPAFVAIPTYLKDHTGATANKDGEVGNNDGETNVVAGNAHAS